MLADSAPEEVQVPCSWPLQFPVGLHHEVSSLRLTEVSLCVLRLTCLLRGRSGAGPPRTPKASCWVIQLVPVQSRLCKTSKRGNGPAATVLATVAWCLSGEMGGGVFSSVSLAGEAFEDCIF